MYKTTGNGEEDMVIQIRQGLKLFMHYLISKVEEVLTAIFNGVK